MDGTCFHSLGLRRDVSAMQITMGSCWASRLCHATRWRSSSRTFSNSQHFGVHSLLLNPARSVIERLHKSTGVVGLGIG